MAIYLRPHLLSDAIEALAARPLAVLAGGTDHYPARVGRTVDEAILDITGLTALDGIEERAEHWRIGALTRWATLRDAPLPGWFDGLRAAARDCAHPSIRRRPASHLREDSDLGDLPATVEVGDLPAAAVAEALARGAASAEAMRRTGLIQGARLALQGQVRRVGLDSPSTGLQAAP